MMKDNEFNSHFQGNLNMMRIASSSLGYGPMPLPDQEIEQRLTLNRRGQVWFSNYLFGDGITRQVNRKERSTIPGKDATQILELIANAFRIEPDHHLFTDTGIWKLELINDVGWSFHYAGSVVDRGNDDLLNQASVELRRVLGMPELIAFDGCIRC